MAYSRPDLCHHPSLVLSYPEHELVCTHCGLVTEKTYFDQTRVVDEMVEGEIRIFLSDIMCNLHIPMGVMDSTFFTYQRLRGDERLSRINNKVVATFALFDTLNERGIFKSEHELCYSAGIDPHTFWCVQKQLNYEPRVASATLVEQMGGSLDFPFFLNSEVVCQVERIKEKSYSKLATIVACAFYKIVLDKSLDIPLNRIARAANVSKPTILALYKKIQNNP